ncbi:MAG: hypothetical protein ING10_06845 [Roseomonas sp.]|nr:hypothetical protein [Roseomonas sp.]
MSSILGGWGFAMFLWTKVMFEVFREGITVLGALLIAISFAIFVYVFSGRAIKIFSAIDNSPIHFRVGFYTLIRKSIIPFMGYSVFFIFVARLVIVGFSRSLNRELEFLGWNGNISAQFAYFCVIMLLPCVLFYFFILSRTLKNR